MLSHTVMNGCIFAVMVLKKKLWYVYYCKTVKPLTMIESFSMGIITIKENFSKEKNMELFIKIYESGIVF